MYGMALLCVCVFASVYQQLQLSFSWHWSCSMSVHVFLFLSLLHKVCGRFFLGKLYNHLAWQEHCLFIAVFMRIRHWSVFWPSWIYCVYLRLFLIFTSVFSYLHPYVQCGVPFGGFGLKVYVIFQSHPFSCYMMCLSQRWYLMTSMTNEAPGYVFSIYIPSLKFGNLQPLFSNYLSMCCSHCGMSA
jgi:hypothetical protein